MYKRSIRVISQLLALIMLATTMLGVGSVNVLASDTTNSSNIDVWDFGGQTEAGSSYTNHITVNKLNGLAPLVQAGLFKQNTTFDDLTVVTPGNYQRLYYYDGASNGSLSYGTPTTKTFSDGYANKGTIYFAGNGDDSTKYIKIDNVAAGDIINLYGFVTNGSGPATVNFALTNSITHTTVTKNTDTLSLSAQKLAYHALDSGTLKIYFTNSGSFKPNIARITKTPGVKISGSLNLNGNALSGHSLLFQNQTTAAIHQVTLKSDGTFEATLTAGYSYTAILQGVSSEYSISDSTKSVIAEMSDISNGIGHISLDVAKIPMATISGKITGFDSSYDMSNLKITFDPPPGSLAPPVEAAINKSAMAYTADVRTGVAYTTIMMGASDYGLAGASGVNINANTTLDMAVVKQADFTATGTFVGLPSTVTVSSIRFTNVNDGYMYTGIVTDTGRGYTVSLRNGAYTVTAVCSDTTYSTTGHVVVNGSNTAKDIKFSTSTAPSPLAWVGDLYVGDGSKINNFTSVKEALAAAARMNPTSEEQRITIHIAPGIYRAQLKVATPYISLINADPSKEVKLTWYYGVGYDYYSAGSDGFYNEDRALDKYSKGYPGNFKWGATVFITSAAKGFRAENIVFENSFNKYMTQEELDDGVQVTSGTPTNLTVRTAGLDATSRAATERAAAIGVEADNAEFYRCSFLSNQDTLYTGNTLTNQYYKDSFIEGNTDYIFGDGNLVFDNCILNFTGYSDQGAGGYITAAKPALGSNTQFYGYLFRNCTITGTSSKLQAPGYLGRPWGQDAKVTFLDTKLQDSSFIVPQGWTSMGTSTPEKAGFYEYNTTYNGVKVDTAARNGKVLSGEAAVINVSNYFGSDWTPKYYTPGSVTSPMLEVSSISNTQAVLSWQRSTSTLGSVIYAVYKDGQQLGTTTETAYTALGLAPSTSYTFKVKAINTAGNTAVSSDVQATTTTTTSGVPSAPTITTIPGNRTAAITWSTVTNATYYTVKGLSAGSTVYNMVYTINSPTVTSYTYSGLTNGAAYEFIVTASNSYGESASSNVVTVTPGQKAKIKPEDFLLGENGNVGSPAITGSSSFDDDANLFTLTGSGTGINKNATGLDQFYIAAVKIKGDYTISGKVNYEDYTPGLFGNMGLIIRESLDDNSYYFAQIEQYASTAVGGRKLFRYNGSSNGSNNNMLLNGTAYIRLTKDGDKITSMFSSSPIPENPVASSTVAISTTTATNLGIDANGSQKELYVGLLVTSANASKSVTATFEDVKIVMADGTVAFDANEGKPIAPKNVVTKPYDKSAILTWDALSRAASYTVKQSTSEQGPFTQVQNVSGSVYQTLISGLENDQTYYFVVTASNASGESVPSKVVNVTPSATTLLPPVLTMTSAAPAGNVFGALLPFSGSVDKKSILTIKNNGSFVKLDGTNTSLSLNKNGTFSLSLILVQGLNDIQIQAVDTYGNATTLNYTVIYTYKAANIKFYDTNEHAVSGLAPGEEIRVKAEVENYIASFQDTVMVVGLYDAHNNLIKFIFTAETLSNGETDMLYAKLKLPDDVKGHTLKAYLWDNATDMRPISDVVVLK